MTKRHKQSSDVSSSASDEDDEEEKFHVEVITEARVIEKKNFEYHVKWAGYGSDEDSWEPYDHVEDCARLLRSFWKEIGPEKEVQPGRIGKIYRASDEWIRKERALFRKMNDDSKVYGIEAEKQLQRNEVRERRTGSSKNSTDGQPKKKKSKHAVEPSSEDSDDIPLSLRKNLKNKGNAIDKATAKATQSDKARSESPDSVNSLFDDSLYSSKPSKSASAGTGPASSSANKADLPHRHYKTLPKVQAISVPLTVVPGRIAAKDKVHRMVGDFSRGERLPTANKYAGMKINKTSKNTSAAVHASSSITESGKDSAMRRSGIDLTSTNLRSTIRELTAVTNAASKVTPSTLRSGIISDQVDDILATIAPDSAVESQKYELLSKQGATDERPSRKISELKFEKKWKWSGALFLDRGEQSDERICDIIISDASESSEATFKFSHLLQPSEERLRLTKFHKASELHLSLPAFKRVHQFAKISVKDSEQASSFRLLQIYLQKGKYASLIPVELPYFGRVAEYIIFPSADENLCSRLVVPYSLRNIDGLIIALLPWRNSPSHFNSKRHRTPSDMFSKLYPHQFQLSRCNTRLQVSQSYQSALSLLEMPDNLLKFLPKKTYCIWVTPVEEKPPEQGRNFSAIRKGLQEDTKALLAILDKNEAQNVGYKADLRIVFIHVAALRTFTKLPALVERREKRQEIRFYTYGFHFSISPAYWGVHEVYPIGGILTFTASALLQNPVGALKLLTRVHQHPLWASFIMPSVLAEFAIKYYEFADPTEKFRQEPGLPAKIIDLIKQGAVSLLPFIFHDADSAGKNAWIEWQLLLLRMSDHDILKECCKLYNAASSKNHLTVTDIAASMSSFHIQPSIRKSYRRFVVIKSHKETDIAYDKDGFEWKILDEFDFRDNFFPKKSYHSV